MIPMFRVFSSAIFLGMSVVSSIRCESRKKARPGPGPATGDRPDSSYVSRVSIDRG
jgi:hypothetical protein